jgi:hypothetical protein
MPFGNFKTLQEVALAYQVRVVFGSFLRAQSHPVNPHLEEELKFNLEKIAVRISEAAIDTFLIAPILRDVWKSYTDALMLWSHAPLDAGDSLQGVPDYTFTRCSPLGMVQDKPYLLVVEAKKDDFDAGWGQCLAAMLAAQKLNRPDEWPLYGCVTNGVLWSFGKLEGQTFTQELTDYALRDLPALIGALHAIFDLAKQHALAA